MASHHEIVQIDFRANSGKANPAIESLRQSAKEANAQIAELKKQLADGRAAGMAKAELEKLEKQIEKNDKAAKAFQRAERELVKGVGTLNQAIEDFNNGSLEQMSVAFQKAAKNAAELQKTKLKPDSETYKKDLAELDALIDRLTENLAKAKLRTEELVEAIQKKGKISRQDLAQEAQALEEVMRIIPMGNKEYKEYANSLTVIKNKLDEVALAERRAAGQDTLKKAQGGGFAQASVEDISKAIAKLKEYQNLIYAPNSLGKKQYQETVDAIKKLEAQLGSLQTISKESDAVLKSPKGKSFNELKLAVEEGRAALAKMRTTTDEEKKAFDELAAKVKAADIEMKNLGNSSKGSASSFEKAWSRLKTYVTLYVGAAVAMQKIVATMGDLMELSDKMGEVRKTTGFTADEVGRLSDALAKMDVRTSLTGLMELSAVAGQLGLKTEQDVKGFTEAANMLMVALPEMGKEGATAMLKVALATGEIDKIREQMKQGLVEGSDAVSVAMTKIGSTIDYLRANSAAAAPAITDFVKRVGAVGAQSGITIDQVAALGATVDALGMRVEMSATALSRMIPAIRNNAFEIGKVIGISQESIEKMYDQGRAMEVFLMILEKMRGKDAESIEQMFGMGGMGEIMKDLNQQGARAGIVFAGLSQNVEVLKEQLGNAATAYQQNIAIQEEYNKMNETTAAKWARLKNQFEEMFVSHRMQRILGGIIDGLRKIVDLISGPLNRTLFVLSITWGAFKLGIGEAAVSLWKYMKNLNSNLETLATKMSKLSKANLWGAAIAAVAALAYKVWEYHNALKEAAAETGRFLQKVKEEQDALGKMFTELNKSNLATSQRSKLISEINSKYSKYLGYMLSETTQAGQLAEAHALVAQRIREEAYEKRILDQENAVREKYGEDVNAAYGKIAKVVRRGIKGGTDVNEVSDFLKDVVDINIGGNSGTVFNRVWDAIKTLVAEGKLDSTYKNEISTQVMRYYAIVKEQANKMEEVTAASRADLRNAQRQGAGKANAGLGTLVGNLSKFGAAGSASNVTKQNVADFVKAQDELRGYIQANEELITDMSALANAKSYLLSEEEIEKYRAMIPESAGGTNPLGGKSVYGSGSGNPLDYANMTGEILAARRHQMENYVASIQTDSDIAAMLSKDPALKQAIENGMSADMQTVIAWYNTERLKIEEELKSRNLTNDAKWRAPEKGGKGKSKQVASDDAVAELDRYYAWRKEQIEQSRIEEGITEAEYNRRIEAMEQEHLQKRSDLRKTFTTKDGQFVEQFRQWWKSVKELDDVSWKSIEAEWRVAHDEERHQNNKKAEKDLAAMGAIVVKQLNAIDDIISKERPYDGITRNLQDNLIKMGILFKDMDEMNAAALARGAEKAFGDAEYVRQNTERIAFLLQEAEHAYSLTAEQLFRDMADNGMAAWADELSKNERMKEALMAQLRTAYDAVQEAIKKEATLIRKQVDIMWNDAPGGGQSQKGMFEGMIARLGLSEDGVKRANSLIGAGQASERVADKLALKQMELRLRMQETYYNMMRKVGLERIEQLKALGKLEDAEHVRKSLNLSLSEEQKKLDEQRVAIANQLEESQNRLYKELRDWGTLFSSGLQSVFEASNTGQAEYYTERAKKRLAGMAGSQQRYVVVENAGTKNASASYRTLTDEDVLDIEQRNAMADAWKKLMDDLNAKMSETITDQLNAILQSQSLDANTSAVLANTEAVSGLTSAMSGESDSGMPLLVDHGGDPDKSPCFNQIEGSNAATETILDNAKTQAEATKDANDKITKNTQSAFAKMTQAANLYGIAYQAVSNDNMSAAQKFGMIAVQAAGQTAITSLTVGQSQMVGDVAKDMPGVLGKIYKTLGPVGGSIAFAAFTGLMGGLVGLAASKIGKAKSEIAQATGTSSSAGKLSTGMQTYAEGNVNEFTDPGTLTAGRTYNVDAADGRTYRARYMGRNPKTHITNGPEFHLAGEKGREAIIDAHTTRLITMDYNGIWRDIQTLYNGGSLAVPSGRRGMRGMRAFAEGNLSEFSDYSEFSEGMDMAAMQASLDRNSAVQEALLARLNEPIQTFVAVQGKYGIVNGYDQGKKEAQSYGLKYIP